MINLTIDSGGKPDNNIDYSKGYHVYATYDEGSAIGELPATEREKFEKSFSTIFYSPIFLGIVGILGVIFSVLYIRYVKKIRNREYLLSDLKSQLMEYQSDYHYIRNREEKMLKYRPPTEEVEKNEKILKYQDWKERILTSLGTLMNQIEDYHNNGQINTRDYALYKNNVHGLIEDINNDKIYKDYKSN